MKSKQRKGDSLHKKNIIKHTGKRARERYNLWSEQDVFFICREIKQYISIFSGTSSEQNSITKSGGVIFLYRETRISEKYHYLIEWRNKYYWAVWNNLLQTINTFLPLDGLRDKIGRMNNSTVGFLSARNLINLDDYQILNVVRVRPTSSRKEIINNDQLWEYNSEHNEYCIPHHLDHNQQEQPSPDPHD